MRNTICATLTAITPHPVSWKFKVVPLTYTTDRDAWTLTLNNAGTLESLLSEGWSVVRTDVLPGLNGERRVQGAAEHMLRTVTAADARLHPR